MKRTLFVLTLIASSYIHAIPFEQAKADLERAQANYDAALKREGSLKTKIDAEQKQIASVSGQVEYADDMESKKEANRRTIEQHNQAVDECKNQLAALQEKISEVGKEHVVTTSGNKTTVVKTEQKKLEPITVQSGQTATRQPYAAKGNHYPRAAR